LLRGLDGPIEQFNRRLLGHLGEDKLQLLIAILDAARGAP